MASTLKILDVSGNCGIGQNGIKDLHLIKLYAYGNKKILHLIKLCGNEKIKDVSQMASIFKIYF